MKSEILLIILLVLVMGVIFRSDLIATAACILLILKFLNINMAFSFIEKHGLETGLLFLLLSILTPLIITQQPVEKELLYNMTSLSGIIAIIGGTLATHLNQHGLQLLQTEP